MLGVDESNLKIILTRVSDIYDKNQAIRREKLRRGECYNIFNTLGMRSDELGLHSKFIADLLNPNANHGMGAEFLKAFIEGLDDEMITKSLSEEHYRNAQVASDYVIGPITENLEGGGRVDILIRIKGFIIIIENKVFSEDQPKRLIRYRNFAVSKLQYFRILYLTLDGRSPGEISTGPVAGGKEFWQCVSYRDFIVGWLEKCLELSARRPLVRETIAQYLDLIRELTNQNGEDEMEKEYMDLLLQGNNLKICTELSNYVIEAKRLIVGVMTDEIVEYAKEKGMDTDGVFSDEIHSGVNFKKSINDREIIVSFEFGGKNYVDLFYGVLRQSIDQSLQTQIFDILSKEKNSEQSSNTFCWIGELSVGLQNWDEEVLIDMNKNPQKYARSITDKAAEVFSILSGKL